MAARWSIPLDKLAEQQKEQDNAKALQGQIDALAPRPGPATVSPPIDAPAPAQSAPINLPPPPRAFGPSASAGRPITPSADLFPAAAPSWFNAA